jgi:hypothetical protein
MPKNSFSVHGFLTVCECDYENPDFSQIAASIRGDSESVLQKDNIILNNGLSCMAVLLGGAKGAPYGSGTSTNPPTIPPPSGTAIGSQADVTPLVMEIGNGNSPTSLDPTTTNGCNNVVLLPHVYVLYPTAYSVSYVGLIPPTVLASSTLTEEALRVGNGIVFAKTNFLITVNPSLTVGYAFAHTFTFARG